MLNASGSRGVPTIIGKIMSLAEIQAYPRIKAMCHTGSREICNPAPTDTDDDWLVLIDPEDKDHFYDWFRAAVHDGELMPMDQMWEIGGSHIDGRESEFTSYRKGEFNIIMTTDPLFYQYFEAATTVAKKLNLLDKEDRIMLFNAVMSGKKYDPVEQTEIPF
jgi:hypothetical protein